MVISARERTREAIDFLLQLVELTAQARGTVLDVRGGLALGDLGSDVFGRLGRLVQQVLDLRRELDSTFIDRDRRRRPIQLIAS